MHGGTKVWPMIVKEFRQLRRDRRTLAMMIAMPLVLLTVFGYAARFDVDEIPTAVVGEQADVLTAQLPASIDVISVDATGDREDAQDLLRRGEAAVAIYAGPDPVIYADGSELFMAQALLRRAATLSIPVEVMFNPDLSTALVMVPALIGLIMAFIGTIVTSLGVVRERADGTLEQLSVMPLKPRDVIVGKIAPYFLVATVDIVLITVAGLLVFDVPFQGSVLVFALLAFLFLLVVLGLGVLISTVSRTQGEAIQLAIMVMLPQILLSGMIFPLSSMAAGVRWIGHLLPLTYFVRASRGILLRGTPLDALLLPLGVLGLMAVVILGAAVFRFHRDVAPAGAAEIVNVAVEGAPA
jgi:ABC-2 type transport system permease protein